MNELVKFDPVKAEMAAFEKENDDLVFDYKDPQGNKDARSHIFKLRKIKTVIADIHKEAKAEALGVCRMLDAEKKALTLRVEGWIDVHYKPVKAIEDREAKAAAVKANAERLEAIRVEAERAAETERREKELAEREAAVKAKEVELAVEKDKQVAVGQAVEAEKERHREEAEAKASIAKMEAEVERKRVADVVHRDKIETDIADAIREIASVAEESGQIIDENIIDALIDNEIPHVTINY